MSIASLLHRDHTVASPGFNRWMVPPAALCIHLCIGQAYAFSVFNLPMTKLIGITKSAPGDWGLTELGWIFSIAIFFLGASAAARPLGGGGRAPVRHVHLGALFRGRFPVFRRRRPPAPVVDHLSRLRRARGYRPWAGVHLAGFDSDKMLPGPSRHGNGHGDHGVRR